MIADLRARAEGAGLVEVAYRTVASPLGELMIAATPRGVVRVAFAQEGIDAVLQVLADRISPRILWWPARLDDAARQLDDYFAGRRTQFDLALDWSLARGFRGQVQRHLCQIPHGQTRSYGELARELGNPRAVRAVGTACATNPLPVVVPCHRVLRSNGGLGGYLGGTPAKALLLELEGVAPPRRP